MNEKMQSLLKILIIVTAIILILVIKVIPEYKESKGSSDINVDINAYESIVEIKINNKSNFLLLITKSKISNILFLEETSLCLYNQYIENKELEKGIGSIITILFENKLITEKSEIVLTKYKEAYYDEIKNIVVTKLTEKNITTTYSENVTTIEERAANLLIDVKDEKTGIKQLELYSKELIRYKKNNLSSKLKEENINNPINSTTSKAYADSIYKKISNYAINNKIVSQEINSSDLPINLIPADAEGTIYPTNESWYYIKDNKVYSYIVIEESNLKYDFCYKGAIENIKKGKCE